MQKTDYKNEYKRLKKYAAILFIVWTGIIAISSYLNISSINAHIDEIAKSEAIANFNKDQAVRFWASRHGGIYVPMNKRTLPNPNLSHIPFREIVKPDGDTLTLMNPAYMIRQMFEEYPKEYGVVGRIVSVKPLNKNNMADEWERDALAKFKSGTPEVFEFTNLNGKEYLRLMHPMKTEESCLKCHGFQGYKVGDIRGGVGVSVPMENLRSHGANQKQNDLAWHLLIYFLGSGLIFVGKRRYHKSIAVREKIDTELSKLTERLKLALDATNDGILDWDLNSNSIYWSGNVFSIIGYENDGIQVTFNEFSRFIHPEEKKEVLSSINDIYESKSKTFNLQFRFLGKDEKYRWVLLRGKTVEFNQDGSGKRVLGTLSDITDQKQTEQAVIENQRLSAIGEMSSSIAHDFNNSLQSILGNLEIALLKLEPDHISRKFLEKMKSATEDSSKRIKLLQRFAGSSKQRGDHTNLDLNLLVKEVLDQSRPLWKDKPEKIGISIFIETILGEDSLIKGDEAELRSVLYNIIKNSVEALPNGGKIIITTYKDENGLNLVIEDNGIGMEDEIQARAFQPFFTTKGFDTGRGLGLSGAYSIIKDHFGSIKILESAPGKGTSIQIVFPSVDGIVNEAKQNNEDGKAVNVSLRILWVDDEKMLREVADQIIKNLGHSGKVAASGDEALKILESETFDLLISDIGMPGINGWDLVDRITKTDIVREMKIILLTGWGDEIDDNERREHNVDFILSKPVKMNKLDEIIRKVMWRKD